MPAYGSTQMSYSMEGFSGYALKSVKLFQFQQHDGATVGKLGEKFHNYLLSGMLGPAWWFAVIAGDGKDIRYPQV